MSGKKFPHSRKRKTPVASQLNNTIKEKKKQLQQNQDKVALRQKLEKEKVQIHASLLSLVGPENILKTKVHQRRLLDIDQALRELDENVVEKSMHKYMAAVDKLEHAAQQDSNQQQKPALQLENRLHPPRPNRRSIFENMSQRDAARWQLVRAHKKRYAVMFAQDHSLKPMVNAIDTCEACGVDRQVDKETAISVCPKCGSTRRFASHIFETKDVEKDDGANTKQQSLSHMQKFSAQFERGYPNTPVDLLEPISVAYQKIHLHDFNKVQSCRTSHLLKSIPNMPKVFRRAPDRLTKELKRESIPEYTAEELSLLLNQRNRLRTPEEVTDGGDQKHKKSFSNQFYLRQLGRTNQMAQSRLFQHAKTCKIHMERTRSLEREMEACKTKSGGPEMLWKLFPNS